MSDQGLEIADGTEAKTVIIDQLARALQVIQHQAPARIATLGGDCAVSVSPFSTLAHRYRDDLAILWIDSHPDIGTPASQYPGFHAMAIAALTGHGDPDIPNVAEWGIQTFSPDQLCHVDSTSGAVEVMTGGRRKAGG